MLPPVDGHVLAANPKFEALYRDLCANKLNEDGSSRLDAKALKEKQVAEEDLRRIRLDAAKRDIIQSGLQQLAYRGDALPEELQELVAIAAASLGGQIEAEDGDVVLDELDEFKENIRPIAQALSAELQHDAKSIARLLEPDRRLPLDELPATIRRLQSHIASSHAQLAESRVALASQTSDLHDLYRQVIETSVRILEQTIHGSISRGTKAKADYLALVAEGMSKKLSVQHGQLMQQAYSAEMQSMLTSRSREIGAESMALKRQVRAAEDALEQYQSARGIKEMVREYAAIERESAKIKEEIVRLEAGAT